MTALAEAEEMRVKVQKGKLHRTEDIEFVITQIYTAIKATLLAIPSRTARLVVGKTDLHAINSILTDEIHHALSELVEINSATFATQNEAYLEALFPPAPKSGNGNGEQQALSDEAVVTAADELE